MLILRVKLVYITTITVITDITTLISTTATTNNCHNHNDNFIDSVKPFRYYVEAVPYYSSSLWKTSSTKTFCTM